MPTPKATANAPTRPMYFAYLLQELGCDAERIAALVASGAVRLPKPAAGA